MISGAKYSGVPHNVHVLKGRKQTLEISLYSSTPYNLLSNPTEKSPLLICYA